MSEPIEKLSYVAATTGLDDVLVFLEITVAFDSLLVQTERTNKNKREREKKEFKLVRKDD